MWFWDLGSLLTSQFCEFIKFYLQNQTLNSKSILVFIQLVNQKNQNSKPILKKLKPKLKK